MIPTIDRNPDIDLDRQKIPPGMSLIKGKNLMHTARSKKIPFGVASAAQATADRRGYSRRETVGLIIRNEDVERFNSAVAAKSSHQKGAAYDSLFEERKAEHENAIDIFVELHELRHAVKTLRDAKGRFHTEQATKKLFELLP